MNSISNKLTDKLYSLYLKNRWNGVMEDQSDPMSAQERAYCRLQSRLSGTQVSKITNLERADSYSDFARTAVERSYDDFKLMVDMTLDRGCRNVLFKDRPSYVGLSSGTTGHNSKRIVFNKGMENVFNDYQLSVASILAQCSSYSFLTQDRLTWGSSPIVGETEAGVPCGYVSGFLATHAHPLSKPRSLPSLEIASMDNMDEKIRPAGEQARCRDLRMISGVPSYIVHFLEELKKVWGVENFHGIWPELNLIVYSGTGIDSYRNQIQSLLGHEVRFVGLYVSTEGPFGYEIPAANGGESGVYAFHYGDIIYTFRRLDEMAHAQNRFLTIGDLKTNDEVELFISSPNGLINYRTGDCLKIRSIFPFLTFEIIGRIGHGVNIAAEKVTLSQLNKTAARLDQETQLGLRHFFVLPGRSASARPCYEWILLADRPQALPTEQVRDILDETLMDLNSDYRENRLDLGFLDVPSLQILSSELADQYFEKASHRGQLKMKVAFDSREKFQTFLSELGLDASGLIDAWAGAEAL